jgi:hypothetical protein
MTELGSDRHATDSASITIPAEILTIHQNPGGFSRWLTLVGEPEQQSLIENKPAP